MLLSNAVSTAGFALIAGTMAAPAEHTIDKRQSTGLSSAFLSFAASEFQKLFGSPPPCCDIGGYADVGLECWAAKPNKTVDPDASWTLCYTPDKKDNKGNIHQLHTWGGDDVEVAKCVTDLHVAQKDTCIDIKGSSCKKDYGGRMQNLRTSSPYAHTKLAKEDGVQIKKAMTALQGQDLVTDKINGFNIGPIFASMSKENGLERAEMWVHYVGEDDC